MKYKALFPDAIYDNDVGGDLRVQCYGLEDNLTGKQVIKFREVVADYLADLNATLVANVAAGGTLTIAQLKTNAVNRVK